MMLVNPVWVEEAIKAAGAKVKDLPVYSPALTPTELMWAKVKLILEATGAGTEEQLLDGICTDFERFGSVIVVILPARVRRISQVWKDEIPPLSGIGRRGYIFILRRTARFSPSAGAPLRQ